MQFSAKNVSGKATSQAANSPWVSITQTAAKAACTSLGSHYYLISNAEYMTIAQNAENVDSNWSGGTVGSGMMSRGHSDNSPANSLAVTNINDPYDGTGNNSGQAPGSGWEQKRTFTLSNGNTIWDIAGNTWEWVDWSAPTTCNTGWTELPSVSCGALSAADYLPTQTFYTSTQGVGQFNGGTGGAAQRGGHWGSGMNDGAFTLYLGSTPVTISSGIGFRCVYRP